ncbi:hypothetical protein [Actinokineospora globicatena]|uniref:hypothetical protein n=1 Tax=Actinokineospora globicatena TaxID=103729 RepID=UPI0020A3DCAA|nr:hypothetical protein [Actinokineospora globicatena]MCP2303347.1 hypothetical protein [Actinokineospora globicatena]GLW79520.1 hypothetical protein Aglo01_40020 [Actinokineospora globicatena]GLW86070.1 hypothetical protein Aglo02_37090 [Actinokineospora globicatena]
MTTEIRLSTVDDLAEVLRLPVDAVGLGQEGCLTKAPDLDVLRRAADAVRDAGKQVVVVSPIAWPRTADTVVERAMAVLGDGPTTVTVNDLGTAIALSGSGCTLVAGLGLTRQRAHNGAVAATGPVAPVIDVALVDTLGIDQVEVDLDMQLAGIAAHRVRQVLDAVPVAFGRSCPTARHARTGPPDCRPLCDAPRTITAASRWKLVHGHREPLPTGTRALELTVWGNGVYQRTTGSPVTDYQIIDARWHPGAALAERVTALRAARP